MAQAMAVNQPKAPGRGQELKASRHGYNQGKNQYINPKSQVVLLKGLKNKSTWRLLGFCLIFFQKEIMIQENLIELEKTMT